VKFNCDRCQTRYSIGDDKVRGKVLKIRCKTCGNIVVVREQTSTMSVPDSVGATAQVTQSAITSAVTAQPQQARSQQSQPAPSAQSVAGGATGPLPPVPRASSSGNVDWYVAIKGKQHGPASRDDVARLYREGKITDRTYLWNEQMTAWTRLREVPAFAFLMTEPAPQARRPPPPPPPSEEGQQQGAEIIPFDEARRARDQGVSPVTNDPFAAVSSPGLGGDGAPRDSTRVFIMQAGLANRAEKHRRYAYVAAAVVTLLVGVCLLDYQGILEIPGLHSAIAAVAHPKEVSPVANTGAVWDEGEEDPELKCKLMPDREKCIRDTIASNVTKRAKKGGGGGAASKGIAGAGAIGGAGVGNIDIGTTGGGESSGLQRTTDDGALGSASLLTDSERKILASLGTKGPTTPTLRKDADVPAVDTGKVDPAVVSKVVKDNAAAIQDCVEKAAKTGDVPHGKQRLVVSIESTGKVSAARFENGAVNASPVGECIVKVAKKWRFPPFTGDPVDVDMPLLLSAN
jgi:predicted Zn finger-like uncharacterized protein